MPPFLETFVPFAVFCLDGFFGIMKPYLYIAPAVKVDIKMFFVKGNRHFPS
jgi:hypothetical protein